VKFSNKQFEGATLVVHQILSFLFFIFRETRVIYLYKISNNDGSFSTFKDRDEMISTSSFIQN